MILFMILALMLVTLVVFGILVIGIGSGIFLIVFADVIVCAVLIGLLIRWLMKRKH